MEYLFYAAILIIILYFAISSLSTPSRIDYDDDYITQDPTHIGKKPERKDNPESKDKDYTKSDPIHIGKKPESKYDSLLKTNEWRNKREKILYRDGYKCRWCGSMFDLNVHHKYYSAYPNGVLVKPWNYPDDALITLCKDCHKKAHQNKKIKTYHRKYTTKFEN